MKIPKVSLDQWRALHAVVDCGGFAQAAEKLHRSQSSISHAVNRLQSLLDIQVLIIKGRKAVLTEAGKVLLQRSRQLVFDASNIEQLAEHLSDGWEAEVRLAVEVAFPSHYLMETLKEFEPLAKDTRIRLEEVVLSGAEEILYNGKADLVVTPFIPQGFLGEELLQVDFIAVAHPDHSLHKLNKTLSTNDLSRATHVIVSDSGEKGLDAGWIGENRRWTVTSLASARQLIINGLGFGWLPETSIHDELNTHQLKVLPLKQGSVNKATLYLIYAEPDRVGPATQLLANTLKKICKQ